MIEALIEKLFKEIDQRWNIGGNLLVPEEPDILIVLDTIAEKLVSEPAGSVLTVGGLKVEKNENGRLDVYAYVGDYI